MEVRTHVEAIPEALSDGKWDYRVTVQRVSDGRCLTDKVSGGTPIVEAVISRLSRELLAAPPPYNDKMRVKGLWDAMVLVNRAWPELTHAELLGEAGIWRGPASGVYRYLLAEIDRDCLTLDGRA